MLEQLKKTKLQQLNQLMFKHNQLSLTIKIHLNLRLFFTIFYSNFEFNKYSLMN